jgi:hypothetical protein
MRSCCNVSLTASGLAAGARERRQWELLTFVEWHLKYIREEGIPGVTWRARSVEKVHYISYGAGGYNDPRPIDGSDSTGASRLQGRRTIRRQRYRQQEIVLGKSPNHQLRLCYSNIRPGIALNLLVHNQACRWRGSSEELPGSASVATGSCTPAQRQRHVNSVNRAQWEISGTSCRRQMPTGLSQTASGIPQF